MTNLKSLVSGKFEEIPRSARNDKLFGGYRGAGGEMAAKPPSHPQPLLKPLTKCHSERKRGIHLRITKH